MITGEIKNKVDQIWNTFWSGGISNPLSVIEQITYLLFAKRLDDIHTAKEAQANLLGEEIKDPIFEEGQEHLRWSRFKDFDPKRKFDVFKDEVFPFIKSLNGRAGSSYTKFMTDAVFMIPSPTLLDKVVNMIEYIPMHDRDTKGDLYEYMLSKIASAGKNGQFRTPRHIIKMMVELTEPTPLDIICDPACGTCGFLVTAAEYLEEHHKEINRDKKLKAHFNNQMFHGSDFDSSMLRIGAMNMTLHGIDNPKIEDRDSLSEDHADKRDAYTLILANPPFKGSLDHEGVAKDLLQVSKTKKTELLFISLFIKQLKPGGRCACIVPMGVLESDSAAHEQIRKTLIEENNLYAIITLPHWVFKPYASVATAILIFSRCGVSDNVWFYKLENDGFKDDANKTPIPGNELPDLIKLWKIKNTEQYVPVLTKHRFVTRKEIVENDYDLSSSVYLSGYKYPEKYHLHHLDEFFNIEKGNVGAASSTPGNYAFITSAKEQKSHNEWSFNGEAICIPIVSATGHGHASIKNIHYVNGKFEAATIIAVLMIKKGATIYIPYVYFYLLAHKDELLVPLMKGAANVSLNLSRLGKLRIPVPPIKDQIELTKKLAQKRGSIEIASSNLEKAKNEFDIEIQKIKEIL
jgi:type I restriction-modification system DNA methylase subunit